METGSPNPLEDMPWLAELNSAQREAVLHGEGPLLVVAGAGSGKTRTLAYRVAALVSRGVPPERILLLTFTRRASQEMLVRAESVMERGASVTGRVWGGTFHAVAYAQLRTRWAGAGTSAPTLLDRKGRILGRILGGTTRFTAMDLASEIEWAKSRLVSPDRYPIAAAQADRRLAVDPERIAEWFRRYEAEKRKRGLVDFDDLLSQCADAIGTDPSFAAAQRWPEDGTVFRHLGYCCIRLDDIDQAREMYQRAIDLDSRDWEARRGLGVACMITARRTGEAHWQAEALRHWRRALVLKPDQPKRETLEKLIREHSSVQNSLEGLDY